MNRLKLIILPVLAALLVGCAHRLEPGGAYAPTMLVLTTNAGGLLITNQVATIAPDYAFFICDSLYGFAKSTMDLAFKTERDNRLVFWRLSPDIKHALDKIRPSAFDADVAYLKAREAYLASPVPANLTALETALARLQSLSTAAAAVLPKGTP